MLNNYFYESFDLKIDLELGKALVADPSKKEGFIGWRLT